MLLIKNNQALKIKIESDDMGHHLFNEFVENEELERVSDDKYLVIKKPDVKRFSADDLKLDSLVQDFIDQLDLSAIDKMDLTDEEAESLRYSLNWEMAHDVEIARKGLLSLSFIEWYSSLVCEIGGRDWSDAMADCKNIVRGNCSDEYAEIYIQGMDEEESNYLLKEFKTYAYNTPLYFKIELINSTTGDTIADDSLGGIYDSSYQLEYLFETIKELLNNMPELDKELKDIAIEELSRMDHSVVNW